MIAQKEEKNSINLPSFKRIVFFGISLVLISFGVAFSIKANLGTSPTSSLPYVVSLFTRLTVGNVTIILNCSLILLQILIMRREYQLLQLTQIITTFILGYLTDFAIWVINGLSYNNYFQQWILCIIGIITMAVGVSMEVIADLAPLSGEGFCLVVSKKLPVKFSTMKIILDVSFVAAAAIISAVVFRKILGIREGTLAAAIFVGLIVRQVNKPIKRFYEKRIKEKRVR